MQERVQRQQSHGHVPLTAGACRVFAGIGKEMGRPALAEMATVAKLDIGALQREAAGDEW